MFHASPIEQSEHGHLYLSHAGIVGNTFDDVYRQMIRTGAITDELQHTMEYTRLFDAAMKYSNTEHPVRVLHYPRVFAVHSAGFVKHWAIYEEPGRALCAECNRNVPVGSLTEGYCPHCADFILSPELSDEDVFTCVDCGNVKPITERADHAATENTCLDCFCHQRASKIAARISGYTDATVASECEYGDYDDVNEDDVVDALTDLMHLCRFVYDGRGLDWQKVLATATMHYEAETPPLSGENPDETAKYETAMGKCQRCGANKPESELIDDLCKLCRAKDQYDELMKAGGTT